MIKPRGRLTRWSYSTWSLAHRCLYACYLSYIDRAKVEETSHVLQRGITLHKKAENLVRGKITGMPRELNKLSAEYNELRRYAKTKKGVLVEQYWNVDEVFKVAKPYEGKCVLKMDVAIPPTKHEKTALIIDHKSGRVYPEHVKQAELSAVFAKTFYPKSEGVEFEFWYTDLGEIEHYRFENGEVKELRKFWIEEGRKLLALRVFLPEPSERACKYCYHRSDRGGRCKSWKDA